MIIVKCISARIERIGDPEALQIIQRLILHHDDITIDFRTRLAIIFNFRDRVFEADKSLALLDLLHVQGSKAGETEYTKTNQLLRKTIFLLSFSRAVLHGSDNKTLVLRCKDIITDYLEGDGWDSRNTLTCEIIMALGALESSWLLHVLFRVVQKGISAAASESFERW